RLQRPRRRRAAVGLPPARGLRRRTAHHHGRSARERRAHAPAGRVHSRRWLSVRDLHSRAAHRRHGAARRAAAARCGGDPQLDDGEPLPLHRLLRDRARDPARRGARVTFDYHEPRTLAEALALLSALNATVSVRSSRGGRSLPIEELAVDHFTTSLAHGEIITEVILPPIEPGTRETYLKFLPRTADDYATVSVAATLRFAPGGTIAETRIVLGAVGPTPIRARRVEDALRGQPVSRARDAVDLVRDEIDPIDDLRGSAAYKREMARIWTGRALAQVTR